MYYIIKKRLSQLIKLAITTKIGQYFLIFLLFLLMKTKNILFCLFLFNFLFFSKKMLPKKHLAFDLYNHQAVDYLNMLDQQYDE